MAMHTTRHMEYIILTGNHDGFSIPSKTVLQQVCQCGVTVWNVCFLVAMASRFVCQSGDNSPKAHEGAVDGPALLEPISLGSGGTHTLTTTERGTYIHIHCTADAFIHSFLEQ